MLALLQGSHLQETLTSFRTVSWCRRLASSKNISTHSEWLTWVVSSCNRTNASGKIDFFVPWSCLLIIVALADIMWQLSWPLSLVFALYSANWGKYYRCCHSPLRIEVTIGWSTFRDCRFWNTYRQTIFSLCIYPVEQIRALYVGHQREQTLPNLWYFLYCKSSQQVRCARELPVYYGLSGKPRLTYHMCY